MEATPLFAREPDITYVGHDLNRPECVLACASGRLYMSDGRGGVMTIAPDGTQRLIGKSDLTPNGIALCRDGSFLIANLGKGGVWRIDAQGEARPYLTEVDGRTLPGVNFVALDMQERIWASVSAHGTRARTTRSPRRTASSSSSTRPARASSATGSSTPTNAASIRAASTCSSTKRSAAG